MPEEAGQNGPSARDNFTPATRHVIAARAGYRCSYPGCNQLTIGPAKSSETFEDTGFASHIHSASPGGPRGQGSLSSKQITHATNGIWMCGVHETLIDKKSGARFPVQKLQSWKALHEYRTSYEHSGRQAAFGFVRQLALHKSPLFVQDTQIDLAKTTFIIGKNGSGKSALCEWLTILDTSRNVRRWLRRDDLNWTITFDSPAEHQLRARTDSGALILELDRTAVSQNYARSSTVYLDWRGDPAIACDMRRMMDLFGIEEQALRSVVARGSGAFTTNLTFISRESEDADEAGPSNKHPTYTLQCDLAIGHSFTFTQLSSGEQGRVLLEVAMAMAEEATQFGPVLLIFEAKSIGMDWGAMEPYLTHFASADCLYQTIVTSWELPTDIEMLGWQTYTIEGTEAGSRTLRSTNAI